MLSSVVHEGTRVLWHAFDVMTKMSRLHLHKSKIFFKIELQCESLMSMNFSSGILYLFFGYAYGNLNTLLSFSAMPSRQALAISRSMIFTSAKPACLTRCLTAFSAMSSVINISLDPFLQECSLDLSSSSRPKCHLHYLKLHICLVLQQISLRMSLEHVVVCS